MVLFSGEPSSKDFDITLMICLLRNLIPIDIMDILPSATDTSLRAENNTITRGSQEPVISHLVFNLTSKVDRKWRCYT
jgi:hypothetical protein